MKWSAVLGLHAVWIAVFLACPQSELHWAFAIVGTALVGAAGWAGLWDPRAPALRPSGRALGLGLVSGVLMTAATYPLYFAAISLWPPLAHIAGELYAGAPSPSWWGGGALALTVLYEELIWRELLFRLWPERWSPHLRWALCLTAYAAGQSGSGSWAVVALAFACGAVWTAQRMRCNNLWVPVVTHACWTMTILFAHPLVDAFPLAAD